MSNDGLIIENMDLSHIDLAVPVVCFAEPDKISLRAVWQNNMDSTLDVCPRSARKETNVPLHKRS